MEFLAYVIAVLIGISLGLVGGGGSILTVPVLVYLLSVDALLATTYSLFIVGVTSLVGGANAYSRKLIDFRAVALFGIPSILSIFVARHYLLPAIPEYLFTIGNIEITKDVMLMLVFAMLMFGAAFTMIRNDRAAITSNPHPADKDVVQSWAHHHDSHEPNLILILPGLLIGLVTGMLGAGGGFLIIPTLVLIIKLPMKVAVGTSLLIVAINSIFGFVFSISQHIFDWKLLLSFTALAIVGIIVGSKLSDRIPGDTLKKGFGWFIMLMAIYILMKELWH
jgi:uncharacterized protein